MSAARSQTPNPIMWLEAIRPEPIDPRAVELAGRHPMRTVTHAAAAEVGAWSGDTPRQVQAAFDDLAGEWHTRHSPARLDPLTDAIDRGGPLPDHGTWMELGAGDGWASATLAAHAPALLAVELSWRMIAASPDDGVPRLMADASALPMDDHSVSVAVLMNMLLFPSELDRVIEPGGVLLWLSSRSEGTPIHLTPEQVAMAMPGRWGGVAARHGTATWTVLRRQG